MQEVIHAINDATATTTSAWIPVQDAKRVTFVFKRSNHSAGKTVFTVNVSHNASDSVAYAKLIDNVTNTNVQQLTRVSSYDTGAANATKFYTMSPEDVVGYVQVVATETTDGTHNAWVVIDRDK